MKENNTTRICVPVCVTHVSEIESAIARASELGDFVELRLDCLIQAELYEVEHQLKKMLAHSKCPVIFTFRPAEQGGRRELSLKTRLDFGVTLQNALRKGPEDYADVELDVGQVLTKAAEYLPSIPWHRIICSHHDFVGVPSDLEDIYRRMVATRARILKIAVQADDVIDCLPVLRLLDRAQSDGRELIAIAMGDAGVLTRILGPSRGAFLTYGSLDDDAATAPGQTNAFDLLDLYRIRTLNNHTEIMGLVGDHVMHSVSPHIHNAGFATAGLNAVYIPFEVRALDDFVRRMVNPKTREIDWNLRGLSITAPHKSAIMKHLDWIDPIAVEIGAVNTIVISDEGLYGYNTDATAALRPLDGLIELIGARVAVIGAGGAARSLLWSLRNSGAHVTVFARDLERSKSTAHQFGAKYAALEGASFGKFELVINATPLGTLGLSEASSPANAGQLRGAKIAYDLVYNPTETLFMRYSRDAGCEVLGGLEMLIAQAAEQFKLWTGIEAPFKTMRDSALDALRK